MAQPEQYGLPAPFHARPAGVFADVERRMSLFLRALWGRDMKLRPLTGQMRGGVVRRATFADHIIGLPQSYPEAAAQPAFYRAAAAHASAHVAFGSQRRPIGNLTPLQIALVSLIEDARVEHLAIARFPGLRRLWIPFHTAGSEAAVTAECLMARLARALIDDEYRDPHPWVNEARRLSLEQRPRWGDQSLSGALGYCLATP